ncbi:2Fe-2S iron-sulfur cluster-binding protein [Vibrio fluvialis]|uniref:2Fe-2S iron-sulfur cluster-binding protein n=1 Tax=Vibrio fluvialis TaxID=676 RepID=UPI002DD43C42|nr:2Fe-2S iron-sulfur cluster binding domain-containing protein [Vibrio fluvialis]
MAAEEADAILPSKLIEVAFTNSDKLVHIAPGETVHAAAARAGLIIPKACGRGICGACKVNKVSGNVEMLHNGALPMKTWRRVISFPAVVFQPTT